MNNEQKQPLTAEEVERALAHYKEVSKNKEAARYDAVKELEACKKELSEVKRELAIKKDEE